MRTLPTLLIVCLSLVAIKCAVKSSQHSFKPEAGAKNKCEDSLSGEIVKYDTTYDVITDEDPEKRELKIGTILPDLDDSTLLTFVYGSCYLKDGMYTFNNGVQIWDEQDSVYMRAEESFGDDRQQIIYIRGEMAITAVMHNFFCETAIVVRLTDKGWEVTDGYIDEQIIDYVEAELIGIYDGRFLMRYANAGVYSWGHELSQERYAFLYSNKIYGQEINFLLGRSNKYAFPCMDYDSIPETDCDCYDAQGEVTYMYDTTLNSLVFDYFYKTTSADCELQNPVTDSIRQTWYMNSDTCFMANGHKLSEWGEHILDEVKMTEEEIKRTLKPD